LRLLQLSSLWLSSVRCLFQRRERQPFICRLICFLLDLARRTQC
jgi:hypothetical protein